MIRSEVRRRALYMLDEDPTNPVYFTVAEINDLIDEAMEVLSEEVRYQKKTGYVPLRTGCQLYHTLSIDPLCLSPTRVYLMDYEEPLRYTTVLNLSLHENRWMEHTAERPHHWFSLDHQTFGIYPRVTESSGEVLRVDYYTWANPAPSDNAVLPYDDAMLDAVVQYVVYSGLMKRWDIARASDVFADFGSFFQDATFRKEVRRYNYALLQRLGHGEANGFNAY